MTRTLAILFLCAACTAAAPPSPIAPPTPPPADTVAYTSPEHPRCVTRGALPDPACSPGEVLPVDVATLCSQRSEERRHVSITLKRQVREAYGAREGEDGEVDHVIPVCAGGASTFANLWWQPAPDYHAKDAAEAKACRDLCAGRRTLEDVQEQFRTDWRTMR